MWTKFGYKKPDDGERIIWVNTVTGIISDVIASTSLGYSTSDFWEYFPVEDLNSDIKEAEKAVLALIRDNEDLLFLPLSGSGNVDIQCVKFKGCDYRTCAATDRLRLLYQEKRSRERYDTFFIFNTVDSGCN